MSPWQSIGKKTGYLGSFRQLEIMNRFFDDFRTEDNIIFVDPVMGDRGALYPGFTQEFADSMAELCGKADVIVPNLTEACFMLHEEYIESGDSEDYIRNILRRLADLGCKNAVLTGVSFEDGKLGVMAYNKEKDEFSSYYTEKVSESFHGTGDVFSSTCIGGIMNGLSWKDAAVLAADYTSECIRLTIEDPNGNDYGVNFEQAVPMLVERLKK